MSTRHDPADRQAALNDGSADRIVTYDPTLNHFVRKFRDTMDEAIGTGTK